jgi:hypothetical protein
VGIETHPERRIDPELIALHSRLLGSVLMLPLSTILLASMTAGVIGQLMTSASFNGPDGKYADFLRTVLAGVAQLERDIMDD